MMFLLDILTDPTALIALLTLIVMEIVLGIDNLIFVSILSNKLPEHQRKTGRMVGIGLAMFLRLALLSLIAVIVSLTKPVFEIMDHAFSWRDLIMLAGGAFLVWKATTEIHHHMQGAEEAEEDGPSVALGFGTVIFQILLLDLVFSVDSIITAVGMTDQVSIMVIAVVVSVGVMLVAANPLSEFISRNPTVVMLALSFLLMIGMTLVADGLGFHVPKGYIYAAMAFSAAVETLNLLSRRFKKRKKIQNS
ncbi:TerC family protein [Sneathiella sp. P13V-1]|uniref:TerC family protein n=1 Tax=Sneathiella sp. P13V-1 TaxID=2697366 RepID=UPI00187BC44C|nr:TerC family protein [Sneathiella sp. P13V-1]